MLHLPEKEQPHCGRLTELSQWCINLSQHRTRMLKNNNTVNRVRHYWLTGVVRSARLPTLLCRPGDWLRCHYKREEFMAMEKVESLPWSWCRGSRGAWGEMDYFGKALCEPRDSSWVSSLMCDGLECFVWGELRNPWRKSTWSCILHSIRFC